MTRRVRYLIDTPNATLGGYRPGRKGDMGAEAWVREEELTRLREAAEALAHRAAVTRDRGHIGRWREIDAVFAALPPPGGDDEGEG